MPYSRCVSTAFISGGSGKDSRALGLPGLLIAGLDLAAAVEPLDFTVSAMAAVPQTPVKMDFSTWWFGRSRRQQLRMSVSAKLLIIRCAGCPPH